jgi:isoaspartyl peptidase/L-asparaginase-like protein (Ntn-hydrolase superfamily)
MEKTEHTLVVGAGAEQLAQSTGLELVNQDYLVTPEGRREWETYKKYSKAVSSLFRYLCLAKRSAEIL